MEPGVTKEQDGVEDKVWNILGQTYTPKLKSKNALVWYAELPAETFVPPHVHPTQDEWVSMLTGELEIEFGPDKHIAKAGDVVRVRVTEVDIARKRIGLTMRKDNSADKSTSERPTQKTKSTRRTNPETVSPQVENNQGALGAALARAMKQSTNDVGKSKKP